LEGNSWENKFVWEEMSWQTEQILWKETDGKEFQTYISEDKSLGSIEIEYIEGKQIFWMKINL
jgi:hypothetical protein